MRDFTRKISSSYKLLFFLHRTIPPHQKKNNKGLENIPQKLNTQLYTTFSTQHSPTTPSPPTKIHLFNNRQTMALLRKVTPLLVSKEGKIVVDCLPVPIILVFIFLSLFCFDRFIDISHIIIFLMFPSDWNCWITDGLLFGSKTGAIIVFND